MKIEAVFIDTARISNFNIVLFHARTFSVIIRHSTLSNCLHRFIDPLLCVIENYGKSNISVRSATELLSSSYVCGLHINRLRSLIANLTSLCVSRFLPEARIESDMSRHLSIFLLLLWLPPLDACAAAWSWLAIGCVRLPNLVIWSRVFALLSFTNIDERRLVKTSFLIEISTRKSFNWEMSDRAGLLLLLLLRHWNVMT